MSIQMIASIIITIVLWFGFGIGGFIYWWRKDHDLTRGDLLDGLLISSAGPFTWLAGYFIHGKTKDKVIFNKRK